MSVTVEGEVRRRREIEESPDVFFIEISSVRKDGADRTLYAVMFPQDEDMFRINPGSHLSIKYRGRYRNVASVWKQNKDPDEDPAASMPWTTRDFVDYLKGRKGMQ